MKRLCTMFTVTLAIAAAAGQAVAAEDLLSRAKALFKPMPAKPPVLKGNPATPTKVELGAKLYFDPRLSKSHLISCNTCHNVGVGGGDLQITSTGHGWQKGPRNAPTVLNSAYNTAQFWDGRAKDLAEQAKGPVQASVEMNNTPEQVVKTLNSMPEYVKLFKAAFPADKDPVSFDNMAKAIEVFEATLVTPDAPFDRYLKGDKKALNKRETAGLKLFIDKGCVACHGGINLGGTGYYPFGVVAKPSENILPRGDRGRFSVTNTAQDEYVFRSPSLRNVALTYPYFHSGAVWSLKEAVAIMGSAQFGIQLNDGEIDDIAAFLGSLTGKQPKVVYPILPPSSETTPRPVL
ncbi:cytochrome-c peroxidase [Geobacter sp. SVR]|uniref:cytochrome-c peroxidase n=1 Tax=Geobacter sp. SVR TaxID=2495594 RepID=UPI00143EF8BA|nr:cytochrome-c peroxidase [Geobacter sp. SVR]BCS54620.1 cytochrome c biogenesis protein CcsA [Geobacter sp. SVR]GCF86872.1 cytochrome c biogenesis protein CcsA [Geobacter sp. SVR]